jgi:hypothetical protein
MGTAIALRTDFSSRELRRLATRVKDAAQARRLLAIAAVSITVHAATLVGHRRDADQIYRSAFNQTPDPCRRNRPAAARVADCGQFGRGCPGGGNV